MKIAIQMFGHLRTYQDCYKNLYKNLINFYDCDIFIHTWDKIDHDTQAWHDFHMPEDVSKSRLLSDIDKLYHPKLLKMDTQIIEDLGNITANDRQISKSGIKSMLTSMAQANKLRQTYMNQNNVKYDYIICLRPDILLNTPFIFEKYIDRDLMDNSLYTAGNYKLKDRLNDWRYIGASDVLFFTKPNVMDKIFDNFDKLFLQECNQETSKYGPEYSFIHAIKQMEINVFLINYLWGNNFIILRPQNKKTLFNKLFSKH